MNAVDFAHNLITLGLRFRISVTSWGRTTARNKAVGGAGTSRHLDWCGADVVLDIHDAAQKQQLTVAAAKLGLKVIDEKDHIHLQPL